jgi:Fur family ferric uptake transcriptional regulator
MTRQRRVILEELRKLNSHPSADEVHVKVRRRLPRVSLGTVYRNLEILSRRGLIRKLELAGRQKRFDANPEEHCHVRCVRCGRIEDIHESASAMVGRIRRKTRYRIVGHRLEFLGVCPRCRTRGGGRRRLSVDLSGSVW